MRIVPTCNLCHKHVWPWSKYGFANMPYGREMWHAKCYKDLRKFW